MDQPKETLVKKIAFALWQASHDLYDYRKWAERLFVACHSSSLGTGWDINHSLTGKVPLPHFLPDLAEQHFQVSNYHYGAKATPTALQC